jgi:hypothetical protein
MEHTLDGMMNINDAHAELSLIHLSFSLSAEAKAHLLLNYYEDKLRKLITGLSHKYSHVFRDTPNCNNFFLTTGERLNKPSHRIVEVALNLLNDKNDTLKNLYGDQLALHGVDVTHCSTICLYPVGLIINRLQSFISQMDGHEFSFARIPGYSEVLYEYYSASLIKTTGSSYMQLSKRIQEIFATNDISEGRNQVMI